MLFERVAGILRGLRPGNGSSRSFGGGFYDECVVCGRRCGRVRYTSSSGDVWCADHADVPNCPFCAAPAFGPVGSLCRQCSADTVRTTGELNAALRRVGTHMASRGFVVENPAQIVLRERAELEGRGLLGSPHTLGSTRSTYDHTGQVVGRIVIAVVAGLPAAQCEAVIAHEFGHALLVGSHGDDSLPREVNEGFCEALAARYLAGRPAHRDVRLALRHIQNNPDPVYGDGYRLLAPAFERWGETRVLAALRDGDPGQIGVRV
jgi:hypothetical protein